MFNTLLAPNKFIPQTIKSKFLASSKSEGNMISIMHPVSRGTGDENVISRRASS